MLEEIKRVLRDAIKAVSQRIEGVEARVDTVESDLADVKTFVDQLKSAGFGDLRPRHPQAKTSANMWWGARLLFLAGALGPVVHFTAVFLDSVPLFGHVVGS